MLALAKALTAVGRRVVVIFAVVGAPACALTEDGHCVGVRGTAEDVAAQQLWRGAALQLAMALAKHHFKTARVGVIVLGFNGASSLLYPPRSGENGFSTSARQHRFREVYVDG
jgi:hypothetical protein